MWFAFNQSWVFFFFWLVPGRGGDGETVLGFPSGPARTRV